MKNKAKDFSTGKSGNYSSDELISGVRSGQLALEKNEEYHFSKDDGSVFSLSGKSAEQLIKAGAEGVSLYNPEHDKEIPTTSDKIGGALIQAASGLTAGLSDVALTKGLGVSPDTLALKKESAGLVGDVAEFAGMIAPANKLFGVGNILAKGIGNPLVKEVAAGVMGGAISGGIYEGVKSISELASQDKDVSIDVIANQALKSSLYGGLIGGAVPTVLNIAKKVHSSIKRRFGIEAGIDDISIKDPDFHNAETLSINPVGDGKSSLLFKKDLNENILVHDGKGQRWYIDPAVFNDKRVLPLNDVNQLDQLGEAIGITNLGMRYQGSKGSSLRKVTQNKVADEALEEMDDTLTIFSKIKGVTKENIEKKSVALEKKMNERISNSMKQFDSELDKFDFYNLGPDFYFTGNPSSLRDKSGKMVGFMGGERTKMDRPFGKHPSRSGAGILKSAGATADSKMAGLDFDKSSQFAENAWSEYQGKSLTKKIGLLGDHPARVLESVNDRVRILGEKIQEIRGNEIEPIIAGKYGEKILIDSRKIYNFIKSRFLDKISGPSGEVLPGQEEWKKAVVKYLSSVERSSAVQTLDNSYLPWQKMDLFTLEKMIKSAEMDSTAGGAFSKEISSAVKQYADDLMFDSLLKNGRPEVKGAIESIKKTKTELDVGIKLRDKLSTIVQEESSNLGLLDALKRRPGKSLLSWYVGGPLATLIVNPLSNLANMYSYTMAGYIDDIAVKAGKNMRKFLGPTTVVGTRMLTPEIDLEKESMALAEMDLNNNEFMSIGDSPLSNFSETTEGLMRAVNTRKLLSTKLPRNINSTSPLEEPLISEFESNKYKTYRDAVVNPEIALENLGNNSATYDEIQAILDNYPGISRVLMQSIFDSGVKLSELTEDKRHIVKMILGKDSKDVLKFQIKQQAMAPQNNEDIQHERMRKMNIKSQVTSMSKGTNLEAKNLE